jgi:cellulose synthase/poly-beta-1,6-N-acetylglucosamine synthase-like glycosyltransferase
LNSIYIALLFIVICYILLISILAIFWKKNPIFQFNSTPSNSFISLIVPVRNEANSIGDLLEYLNYQSFKYFEVLVIDDNSTDNTSEIVIQMQSKVNYALRLIALPQELIGKAPKKAAITLGVQHAKGELIVTTDGDCKHPTDWLRDIHSFYKQTNAQLIAAPVQMVQESGTDGQFALQNIQEVEFALLTGVGAATMMAGFPTMCSGANLAYTKEAFLKVNGYQGFDHIASGDDEFLMHKIYHVFPKGVKYLKSQGAIVKTIPLQNLKSFFQQRKRWAGKWRAYKHLPSILLAILGSMAHVSLIALLFGSIFLYFDWKIALFLWLMKSLVEIWLCLEVMFFLNKSFKKFQWICMMAFFNSLYVMLIAIVSNFSGYTWKGRKMN